MRQRAFGSIGWLLLGLCALSFTGSLLALPQGEPVDAAPYRVGDNVSRPEKISGNPPVYTEMARKARLQGVVIVEAIIDKNGEVTSARILKGLPMGLDKAALDAVASWKFKPAMRDGKPVKVYYTLTINFQVDGGSYGPIFSKLLSAYPDFAAALSGRRFDEATALLDTLDPRPSQAEMNLARAHLLLEQGQVREAWQLAETERFTNPSPLQEELALAVFAAALEQAHRASEADRAALLELGLQATGEALSATPESVMARAARATVLGAKSRYTSDENARAKLAREVNLLQEEIRSLTEASAAPKERPGAAITLTMGRDPEAPLPVGGEVTAPERISGRNAQYNEVARKARLQGTVRVKAIIDEAGNVIDAWVVEGLPMGLDKQALEAVRTYKFRPATRHGKPVKVEHIVPVEFGVR